MRSFSDAQRQRTILRTHAMTQLNTTLTVAAPSKSGRPIMARLKKSATALRQYCAAWFTPIEMKDTPNYDAWEDITAW